MKKIINGKKYDTETAKLICERQYSYSGDFNYFREELYQKTSGEFFLYGKGGPLSHYAERDGNDICGSCRLEPYSITDAKKFVEHYGTVEDYEEVFGEVEE